MLKLLSATAIPAAGSTSTAPQRRLRATAEGRVGGGAAVDGLSDGRHQQRQGSGLAARQAVGRSKGRRRAVHSARERQQGCTLDTAMGQHAGSDCCRDGVRLRVRLLNLGGRAPSKNYTPLTYLTFIVAALIRPPYVLNFYQRRENNKS